MKQLDLRGVSPRECVEVLAEGGKRIRLTKSAFLASVSAMEMDVRTLSKGTKDPKYLPEISNTTQLASFFNVSIRTIERWKKKGMPFHKKGKRISFLKKDILNWYYSK